MITETKYKWEEERQISMMQVDKKGLRNIAAIVNEE